MPTLYLMCGPPGSGKSHARKRDLPNAHVISPDDIIVEMAGGVYDWTWWRVRNAWKEATARLELEMMAHKNHEEYYGSIVFDAVFQKPKRRKQYIQMAKKYGWTVVAYYIRTPLSVCKERNNLRPENRRVPDDVLERMANEMRAPTREEGFDRVFNVDGTSR